MIKLFWCPQTRASRAMWMLEELGEPYERVHIDIRAEGGRDEPAFRMASPMGKVPALQDGEVHIADSSAICLYLADRYPSAGLAPGIDDAMRGRYLYWMTFTPGVIEPAMSEKANGWTPNRMQSGWGDFDLMVETLIKGVSDGPWLLGDKFSAADVMVGSSVCFMKMFGMLPEHVALDPYVKRCLARPGYKLAMQADQEAVK